MGSGGRGSPRFLLSRPFWGRRDGSELPARPGKACNGSEGAWFIQWSRLGRMLRKTDQQSSYSDYISKCDVTLEAVLKSCRCLAWCRAAEVLSLSEASFSGS